MSISLSQTYSAVAANITSSFLATGGTAPYTYSVLPGGAGGTINARSGVYTAPSQASSSPNGAFDTIKATDSLAAIGTSQILVGTPLMLFCDIIQKGMGLAAGRVFLWDQKIFQPTDYDLYAVVSVPVCKPFGNGLQYVPTTLGLNQIQSVNMLAHLDVDIISRGPAARDQKEKVIMALYSNYAEAQQEANSFSIGRISTNFINLSNIDAAAIPYRYKISCQMQYFVSQTSPAPYFDKFSGFTTTTSN